MRHGELKFRCQLWFAVSSSAFVSHFGKVSKATTLVCMWSCTPSYACMSDLNTCTDNLLPCESLHIHPAASAMVGSEIVSVRQL